MNAQVMQQLRGKEELAYCKKCMRPIWIYWYRGEEYKKVKRMDLCGPCYFGTRKHE